MMDEDEIREAQRQQRDADRARAHDQQALFDVQLHAALEERASPGYVSRSLKVKGDFYIVENLQAGQSVTVQIASADGEIIATGRCRIEYPQFRAIKEKGAVIGTDRLHVAELVE